MPREVYVASKGSFNDNNEPGTYVLGVYEDLESAQYAAIKHEEDKWEEHTKNDYREHYIWTYGDEWAEVERFWVE